MNVFDTSSTRRPMIDQSKRRKRPRLSKDDSGLGALASNLPTEGLRETGLSPYR